VTCSEAEVSADSAELLCRPIGVIHTPFRERLAAPRQASAAREVEGRIVLNSGFGFEHALCDLSGFPYIWVLFWFHQNQGWRPKVLPPRSAHRRGLFSTRSPYRPNPIGLSAVKLERIDGLVLFVRGVDMLDGTPVLDLKPYVPYADAIAGAEGGWLETARDPLPGFSVEFEPSAVRAMEYLHSTWNIDLEEPIRAILTLGPQQHPYRRIRADGDMSVLSVKDWRARFRVDGTHITVHEIVSGYRPRELVTNLDTALDAHRAFAAIRKF
jgi:tRNA (adenine37-N6)-methyltransferase